MAVATFDTAKSVDNLEAAKMSREQARAIVEIVRSSHEAADVATKGDLALLQKDLKNDVEMLRKDMESMESRLLIKLGKMFALGVTLILAAIGMAVRYLS